ncbi:MAG: histidine kinase [Zoogloea oleivorans]|jgi:two-component system sensor histidine kinase UhpB|uniref:HAMP domain-containing sensor histidine kinase n=1 Tax=Zoogloea oleivorans TaxID=1552750 RepID=UPI002A36CC67|nr:ATP-binding protein [Zoogloea oleivorans]MDY0038059.1 histidine kinase [Zoogloea oleivorans]
MSSTAGALATQTGMNDADHKQALASSLSLRLRVSLVLTALATAFVLTGAALWVRDARTAITEEVTAAHRVAAQWLSVSAQGTATGDPAWTESRLLAHLNAVGRIRAHQLEARDASGALRYRSPPSPYKPGRDAPAWFAHWLGPDMPPLTLYAGNLTLHLQPDASRALIDLWDDLAAAAGRALLALVGLFAGCWLAIDRALKPLGTVMTALDRTGQGNFDTRLPVDGPPELAHLAEAFNSMALRLDQAVAENVRLSHEQAVARAVTERLEADRTAIARDLHDELGQSITAVAALAGAIVQRTEHTPDIRQSAEVIRDVASRMQGDVRALLTRLRPPRSGPQETLDDAVRTYLSAWSQRHNDIELTTELFAGPSPLPDEVTLTALRVVQESCTNIVRHALASKARIRLLRDGNCLTVEISDNGRGIMPAPGQSGFGLAGMRERVAELKGHLDISSPAGGGTRIRARLPLAVTSIEPTPETVES